MQELIDHIDNDYLYPHQEVRDYMDRLNNKINELIEKEKEQIINAWMGADNELQRLAAEKYYNKTYNQNK